jgi:dethiobiotin synthetase
VGKTYVAAMIVRALAARRIPVGVYKPAASGCHLRGGQLESDDARILWEAAGRPGPLAAVCPQRFAAPLAPHRAARAEGKKLDPEQLRRGLELWQACCEVVVIEGAGGLMSPLGDDHYVADLAGQFGYPLVIVAPNVLGTINQTLQTLITAATFGDGLPVAGIVLNDLHSTQTDLSAASNLEELQARCDSPVLAHVTWNATEFAEVIDWMAIAGQGR